MSEKQLGKEEIGRLSSSYLTQGRRQDAWEITAVTLGDGRLDASVRMTSYGVSATDKGGFHLSIFSALEFISQLNIIYLHHWADYNEKTLECWMTETAVSNRRMIRDPENIRVEMEVNVIRRIAGKIYIDSSARVSDGEGLFEIRVKAMAN